MQSAYKLFLKRILREGEWVFNERTGKNCLTMIGHTFHYKGSDPAPVQSMRELNLEFAFAEMLGYWKKFDNSKQFEELGTKTWHWNANKTKAWLANPHRKGENDLGIIYGKIAREWPIHNDPDGKTIDLFRSVYEDLSKGYDSRGEIISYWNPGMHHLGALRACMYEYIFSLVGDKLYLTITQRSADAALGVVANMVQAYAILHLMAKITKKIPARVDHHLINCHIYEDQMDSVNELIKREDIPLQTGEAVLTINDRIQTLDDVYNIMTPKDFILTSHRSHPAMKNIPFSE